MTMNETLTMMAIMLAPAFFSLLGMGAFGSPVVSVLGEIAAKSQKRVFYDKYGLQTAGMGFILLMLLLFVDAAALIAAYIKFPQVFKAFINVESPLTTAFYALGVFVALFIPYALAWQKMRNSKGVHMTLGMGAALASLAGVAIGVQAKLLIGLPTESAQAQLDLGFRSMVYPMATMYTILIVTAAAGLSCVYLLFRRNKDDYGRDYYNFALKLAARWALIPMIGFLACQGWLYAVLPENLKALTLGTPLGLVWGVGTGLGLVCAAIWAVIARSETPLQLKGLTFLAVACLWIMHAANATLFVNFMAIFQ